MRIANFPELEDREWAALTYALTIFLLPGKETGAQP